MSNILILNLKRFGDIYSSSHLIKSLRQENPHSKISILVFKEFEQAANNIDIIDTVYTIDRKRIISLKRNPLFNNAFSLNEFNKAIAPVKSIRWNKIINQSNDIVSTYLTSYLTHDTCEVLGIQYNSNSTIKYTNIWSTIFNEVITQNGNSPINFVDMFHQICGVERSAVDHEVLKISTQNEQAARKNIDFIRQSEAKRGNSSKIVGLQLCASVPSKNITIEAQLDLIESLLASNHYFPIILHAPTDDERKIMKAINEEFNNGLVCVESDFKALPCVLKELDVLITPDTSVKHLADIVAIPTLEISVGSSPLFKQGTINPNSLILTPIVNTRSFSSKEVESNQRLKHQNNLIKVTDIMASLDYLSGVSNRTPHSISKGLILYRPVFDTLGIQYQYVAGDVDIATEAFRGTARSYLIKEYTEYNYSESLNSIIKLSHNKLRTWIEKEKIELSNTTKSLLGALRTLLQAKDNKTKMPDFIRQLDGLLAHAETSFLAAIPATIFKSDIENTITESATKNFELVEKNIYELKNKLQSLHDLLKEVEEQIYERSKPAPSVQL